MVALIVVLTTKRPSDPIISSSFAVRKVVIVHKSVISQDYKLIGD